MKKVKDKTLLLLSSIGTAAFLFMSMVVYKPNRISQGIPYSSFDYLGAAGRFILLIWLFLMMLSFIDKKRQTLLIFATTFMLLLSLILSLSANIIDTGVETNSARISFSSGLYVQFFVIYLLFSTYTSKIQSHRYVKWIGALIILMTLSSLMLSGSFDDLSLIKEYHIKRVQFFDNLRIHAMLTFGAVIAGAVIAIPLGFLAYSKKKHEGKIMVPLSIIETIPSLSLFGILLVPLSGLGKLPFFNSIGVSGIGWAPAFIALTLYTLLPIGRNTLTGFHSVDKNIIEAAKGMGMSNGQILTKIELPLAFPVIFTGIRIAFIQTIGGAVLAGLVGGGGMGTFVFLGLGEASPDLILLGVLPIVFFTVMIDYLLKTLDTLIRGAIYD